MQSTFFCGRRRRRLLRPTTAALRHWRSQQSQRSQSVTDGHNGQNGHWRSQQTQSVTGGHNSHNGNNLSLTVTTDKTVTLCHWRSPQIQRSHSVTGGHNRHNGHNLSLAVTTHKGNTLLLAVTRDTTFPSLPVTADTMVTIYTTVTLRHCWSQNTQLSQQHNGHMPSLR